MLPKPVTRAIDAVSSAEVVGDLVERAANGAVKVRDLLIGAALLLVALVLFGALSWRWAALSLLGLLVCCLYLAFRQAQVSSDDARDAGGAETEQKSRFGAPALSTVLAGLPDAAMVLDHTSRLVAANDEARKLFPIVEGRHIVQITRAPELLAAVDTVLGRGEAQFATVRLTPPHDRTLAARLTPIDGGDMAGPSVLVVLRDMTEQERLSRMRADFVANASHELRTPLASLKGFVETLQGAAKDDPKAREQFLAIMQEQASRMSRLIDDLLSLSRIEMHEHVAPSGTVDLAAVVDEAVSALQPLAAASGITLDTADVARPGLVIGDRDELAQVVQNLLQNAVKYGREGGRVGLSVAPAEGRMALTVRDDGIGIAPEHLPRLTERFYRVSAKASRERGGTGLGLAIVKHIASRHRGELRIESKLGQGSAFTVLLPSAATRK